METLQDICLILDALYIRLRRIMVHYWITITAAFLLTAAGLWAAYFERGYRAIGSELLIFPLVIWIGVKLTPPMKRRKAGRNGTVRRH